MSTIPSYKTSGNHRLRSAGLEGTGTRVYNLRLQFRVEVFWVVSLKLSLLW